MHDVQYTCQTTRLPNDALTKRDIGSVGPAALRKFLRENDFSMVIGQFSFPIFRKDVRPVLFMAGCA